MATQGCLPLNQSSSAAAYSHIPVQGSPTQPKSLPEFIPAKIHHLFRRSQSALPPISSRVYVMDRSVSAPAEISQMSQLIKASFEKAIPTPEKRLTRLENIPEKDLDSVKIDVGAQQAFCASHKKRPLPASVK